MYDDIFSLSLGGKGRGDKRVSTLHHFSVALCTCGVVHEAQWLIDLCGEKNSLLF